MSERDDPSLPWCLYFLGWHIQNHIRCRMKHLTWRKQRFFHEGAIISFANLSRWYAEDLWRETKRWVRRYILRQGWKGMP